MQTFDIGGIKVSSDIDDFDFDDAVKYANYVLTHADCSDRLESVEVKKCDDGKVDVNFQFRGQKFERIRRITG